MYSGHHITILLRLVNCNCFWQEEGMGASVSPCSSWIIGS